VQFVHSAKDGNVYSMILSSDYLEIKPKPPTRILEAYVRGLKKFLTKGPQIFLKGAEEKLNSAILNFAEGRYRSVAHDIYYALYNIVQSLAVQSGIDSNIGHGATTQKVLSKIIYEVFSGNHIAFHKSDIWKKHKNIFNQIDPQRYSRTVLDLYEMRRLADYTSEYEIGEFVKKLSNLVLKVEELLNLGHYMLDGSVAYWNERIVRVFQGRRELEPCPSEILQTQRFNGKYKILQKGLVSAENFSLKRFLLRFLGNARIYYTKFLPSQFRQKLYVKYETRGKERIFSQTFDENMAKEKSYIPLTTQTVRKWSQTIKPDEMKSLELEEEMNSRWLTFSDGEFFFELYILSDGRFYIISSLDEQKPNDQIAAILKLRDVLAKVVSSIWEYSSIISFSAISIIAK